MSLDPACGTSACAFGLATFIPEFNEQGLSREKVRYRIEPVFEGYRGYEAAQAFFDISENDSHYLFSPSRYHDGHSHVSEMDVVARIEELVNRDVDCPNSETTE